MVVQPPSGGCVLKHFGNRGNLQQTTQPPSGGCVLKLIELKLTERTTVPAAFRRLCVETSLIAPAAACCSQPPSGGCVLKLNGLPAATTQADQPPSGGCVLKPEGIAAR